MTAEIRIMIEGNSGDGFWYTPVFVCENADECLSPKKSIEPLTLQGNSRESIELILKRIQEALDMPCVANITDVVEVKHPNLGDKTTG